jgi:hypothetical protein
MIDQEDYGKMLQETDLAYRRLQGDYWQLRNSLQRERFWHWSVHTFCIACFLYIISGFFVGG